MKQHRIIITPGEPAGIGPDLVIQLSQYDWPVELVICSDASLLQDRSKLLGLPLKLLPYKVSHQPIPQKKGTLTLFPTSLRTSVVPGQLHVENAHYVLETLTLACDSCLNGEFSALVTGPVHKGLLNKAGILFTGHTEFFRKRSKIQNAIMMLVTEEMRVALVTTHVPIKLVSDLITPNLLRKTITILHYDLRKKFGISQPRILVCGLNPHAGENGYIGTEEVNIIAPILKEMQKKGMHLSGPFPADTIFQPKHLCDSDVVLAMYHDQGLPVLKYQGFHRSVNITLGLPFIRTSVDHGTALDLAGKGKANVNSFIKAINLSIKMIIKNG